jgi:hypothetical protein
VPRREHARFCSAECRVAWNDDRAADWDKAGERPAGMSALDWSIGAIGEVTARLAKVRGWDPARVSGAVSEAVWWVTIVDATLVRYYPDAYDGVLADRSAPERKLVEDTLAGLRFVRNQVGAGRTDFVRSRLDHSGPEPAEADILAWTWISVPRPSLAGLLPRGQSWEMRRYRAYQDRLAGHTIGETFRRAAAFLREAAARAVPAAGVSPQPAP